MKQQRTDDPFNLESGRKLNKAGIVYRIMRVHPSVNAYEIEYAKTYREDGEKFTCWFPATEPQTIYKDYKSAIEALYEFTGDQIKLS